MILLLFQAWRTVDLCIIPIGTHSTERLRDGIALFAPLGMLKKYHVIARNARFLAEFTPR